jgi:hypothetical protein
MHIIHQRILFRVAVHESGVRPGLDLTGFNRLAALAIGHNAHLCSNDNDFGRFPALRWVNPLT